MISSIIYYTFIFLLVLFVWKKIVHPYYKFRFYLKQGIKHTGVGLPLLGSLPKFAKIKKTLNQYSKHMLVEYYHSCLGKDIPAIFMDTRMPDPSLVITDPDMLSELYVTKNKYFAKDDLVRESYYSLVGDSILFSQSNDEW